MQLLFATNYSLLDTFLEIVQVYIVAKEYAIVKLQPKAIYKFNTITKVVITCKCDDKLQRKLEIKQRKTTSIKYNYLFKVNVVYKKSLNI